MTDQYKSTGTPLTDHQRELLTIFEEECLEVIEQCSAMIVQATKAGQRASKALRFGLDDVQPGQPFDNAQRLGQEIGDLCRVIEYMVDSVMIKEDDIQNGFDNKEKQLAKFMQHKE